MKYSGDVIMKVSNSWMDNMCVRWKSHVSGWNLFVRKLGEHVVLIIHIFQHF